MHFGIHHQESRSRAYRAIGVVSMYDTLHSTRNSLQSFRVARIRLVRIHSLRESRNTSSSTKYYCRTSWCVQTSYSRSRSKVPSGKTVNRYNLTTQPGCRSDCMGHERHDVHTTDHSPQGGRNTSLSVCGCLNQQYYCLTIILLPTYL